MSTAPPASDFARREGTKRLHAIAREQVVKTWGTGVAVRLGPVLYRALVAEELLRILATQDETIPAARIREMVSSLWEQLTRDQEVQWS